MSGKFRPTMCLSHMGLNRRIQPPMDEREGCQDIQRILLADRPVDLRRMGRRVAECPEHALDEVHQPCVLAAFALCVEAIERQPWVAGLADSERLIDQGCAV